MEVTVRFAGPKATDTHFRQHGVWRRRTLLPAESQQKVDCQGKT
jgi:hypothetical protein